MLLSKKNTFMSNFQCARQSAIGFSSGALNIHLRAPGRESNSRIAVTGVDMLKRVWIC